GAHLEIPRKVMVYVSDLVNSPMTIGYLKPIILLPAAALNNISVQQVEAVLLHELSHIRRYDYLVNFLVSIINTILYFNPFVKQFMRSIEAERENCCDELVLQFGYDKVSYASALLTLEKISLQRQDLIMAATGKNYLLNRIEKIVGMEKKKGFKKTQLAGVLAALFCVIAFNSFLIIKDEKRQKLAFSYTSVTNPFAVFSEEEDPGRPVQSIPEQAKNQAALARNQTEQTDNKTFRLYPTMAGSESEPPLVTGIMQVAADEVDASLTKEQKQQVKATVNATKKVVSNQQWKAVENEIADAMTLTEKEVARHEYLKEAGQINWQNIEQNLKAQYEVLDWNKVNTNLNQALTVIQLDSLERNYNMVLAQLQKTNQDIAHARATRSPMPDASVTELEKASSELRQKLTTLRAIKNKKVVRL
ncbi:MAG TPA: M56 family metallopeptidase, partial [Flavisolibacter sp.]|nr:M56 family metallopeptidase [Flavisolibacter sp.]